MLQHGRSVLWHPWRPTRIELIITISKAAADWLGSMWSRQPRRHLFSAGQALAGKHPPPPKSAMQQSVPPPPATREHVTCNSHADAWPVPPRSAHTDARSDASMIFPSFTQLVLLAAATKTVLQYARSLQSSRRHGVGLLSKRNSSNTQVLLRHTASWLACVVGSAVPKHEAPRSPACVWELNLFVGLEVLATRLGSQWR